MKVVGKVCLRMLAYLANILLTILLIGVVAGTIMVCAFL